MAGYIGSKAAVVSSGAERKKTFDITGTTTSLTGLSYTVNQVHVFHNGVRLVDGTDFTATNGSSITLTSAAESGDEVVVISYAGYQVSDTVSASQGGTFSGAVDVNAAGAALTLDRTGSDGTILDLKKDGSTVGSIGVINSNNLTINGNASNHTGLQFGTSIIWPMRNAVNADGTVDLGTTTGRFKDAYLSGGVFLGGTGSANKLDDYEEGTWTPAITGITVTSGTFNGTYRKVGGLVSLTMRMENCTLTGSGSTITGLPFTCALRTSSSNPVVYYHADGDKPLGILIEGGTSNAYLQYNTTSNWLNAPFTAGSNRYLAVQMTYTTNS